MNALLVASPFDAKHRRPTAELAGRRNRFVADLAGELIIAHASPGGQLERLFRDLVASGKPLWALDDPTNAHVAAFGTRTIRPADASVLAGVDSVAVRFVGWALARLTYSPGLAKFATCCQG